MNGILPPSQQKKTSLVRYAIGSAVLGAFLALLTFSFPFLPTLSLIAFVGLVVYIFAAYHNQNDLLPTVGLWIIMVLAYWATAAILLPNLIR